MLKRWYVQNFKSFADLPPIDLSMVNVIAGANSSGKSTLIQSMLLLKQSLQYGSEDRPITLNGPILRIGSFDDVKNHKSENDTLRLGMEFEIRPIELSSRGNPRWARSGGYPLHMNTSRSWQDISLFLTYATEDSNEDKNTSHISTNSPTLTSTSLTISGTNNEEANSQFYHFYKNIDEENLDSWEYTANIDETSCSEIVKNKPDARICGGLISYFLPDMPIFEYNHTKNEIINMVESMFDNNRTILSKRINKEEAVSESIIEMINEWLINHDASPISSKNKPYLTTDVNDAIANYLKPTKSLGLYPALDTDDSKVANIIELKNKVIQTMQSEQQEEMRYAAGRANGMDYAINYTSDFFKFGVKYLGPLRDNPRPVYQPEAIENTTDVGYRGEHTAAIYEHNKHKNILYPLPPHTSGDEFVYEIDYDTGRLADAVDIWLAYLGVANNMGTEDAGVFGTRMQVSIEPNSQRHDLTNVGVGVSQVLPIVVMALLAQPGSLLIFEQPELHLHPKVQAKLADFFLALADSGKQSLLETHSEYLIDRLRLRIASSSDEQLRNQINILFSEKQNGISKLTPVKMSEYGAILNWPKDFFDQSQKDVSRILKAAAKKRSLKQNRDN